MSLSFKVLVDDSNTLSRAGILRSQGGGAATPARALYLSNPANFSESLHINNSKVASLHETYTKISRVQLQSLNGDVDKQADHVKRQYGLVRRLSDRSSETKPVVVHFTEFVSDKKPVEPPDEKQTQYLIDLMNLPGISAFSVPVVYGIEGSEYVRFAKTFLELMKSRERVSIVGLIPYVAYQELGPLISLYLDEGIRLFAVDLRGRNPIASWTNVRFVIGTLRKEARLAGEDIFVHALNAGCRSTSRQDIRPATDMLCVTAGFDSFGRSHVTPKVTADLAGPLRRASEETLRVFNRGDYGYHKLSDIESRRFPHEENASTALSDIASANEYRLKMAAKNWFNAERQGLESSTVNNLLTKGEMSIGEHLQSKAFVDSRIRKILSKIWSGIVGSDSSSLDRYR
jgi:hypothetical protein